MPFAVQMWNIYMATQVVNQGPGLESTGAEAGLEGWGEAKISYTRGVRVKKLPTCSESLY
jgi:hypothetical protein